MKTKYLAAALLPLARVAERSNPLKQKRIVWKYVFLLVSLCTLSMGAHAQDLSPKLVIYGSKANSVLVNILNLTPFDMTYADGSLWHQLDKDRHTQKSFMFAPLGVPRVICGSITDPTRQAHTITECIGRPNKTAAPVPFLVSWDDQGGLTLEHSLKWMVHGVTCPEDADPRNCIWSDPWGRRRDDVTLGLWFSRTEPPPPPIGQLFLSTMEMLESSIDAVLEPVNPLAWKDVFLATKELVELGIDFAQWNAEASEGVKMHVYTWPIPHAGSACAQPGKTCQPAINTSSGSYDWVTTAWPSAGGYRFWAGDAEGSLVVVMHVVRGHKPGDATSGTYGSIATVNITIMKPSTFGTASVATTATSTLPKLLRTVLLSNGWGRLRHYLLSHGRAGLFALRDVVESLSIADQQLLIQTTQSTLTGQLRKEEEEVLRTVAKALETGNRP